LKWRTIVLSLAVLPIIFGGCSKTDDTKMGYEEAMKLCEPEIKKAISKALGAGGDVQQTTDRTTTECLKKHGIGHTH